MSLRSRLIAGMALVAAVLAVVAIVITTTTRSQLMGQIDDQLQSVPGPSGDGYLPEPPPDYQYPQAPPDALRGERVSDLYQGFIDPSGVLRTVLLPNRGDQDYAPPVVDGVDIASGNRFVTVEAEDGDVTYRVLIRPSKFGAWVTALPIDGVQATIRRLILIQTLGSLAILAALGVVGWWVAHLGIRPVKQMTQTATRIADGDLTVRVPEGAPNTESGQLAIALNRMLGHIEGALDERAESEQRLRRFVADASHELRTPLTTIRGYAELYRHGGLTENTELDDAMRRTEQEAARMGRLVEDMLTLAKFDEHRPLDLRPLDLVALARDAATDARARTPQRDISFSTDLDAAIVTGDEDRLRQVIGNVVGNAIVHTDPLVPVTIAVHRDNGEVMLDVVDRGRGMPAEVAARVTERFFRADPARSRNRGGSGLGLSIVDAAVSAHGGSVQIDSVEGQGTTVRLILPALA